MRLVDTFGMAIGTLRTNKLRTALTLLGMVIGMFAIITSVTAVEVIKVYFEESFSMLGSSTFSIRRFPSISFSDDPSIWNRKSITYDQLERLEANITMPLTISPEEDFAMTEVQYGEQETEPNVMIYGSNENYPVNFGFEIEEGRGLTRQDVQYNRNVVLLGSAVAEELFPVESPVGKVVRIQGRRFQVVGVLSSKGSFLGFNWDNRVIAPITTMFGIYGQPNRNIASISARTLTPQDMGPGIDHLIGLMRTVRKVPAGEPNDFEIETNDSVQSAFNTLTGTLTVGGAGIGMIALIAAGIGIMNIMLVSVTERTREIGIRKSLGAKRRHITMQFLLEAFVLCQLGGFVGILLGALVGNFTAVYFDITAAFPTAWAFGGFALVSFIALVFGGYPAMKAARLNPVESLRYE
jgi:putative ABC transport system permease protein